MQGAFGNAAHLLDKLVIGLAPLGQIGEVHNGQILKIRLVQLFPYLFDDLLRSPQNGDRKFNDAQCSIPHLVPVGEDDSLVSGGGALQPVAVPFRGRIAFNKASDGVHFPVGQVEIQRADVGVDMAGASGADHHGAHALLPEDVLGSYAGNAHAVMPADFLQQREQCLHSIPAQGILDDLHVLDLGTRFWGQVFLAHIALVQEAMEALCRFIVENDLILVCDQAFQDYIYDGIEFVHPAALPGMWERTVTVCSISKGIGLSGFRIGYIYADDRIMDTLYGDAVNVLGAPCTLSSIGAVAAIRDKATSTTTMFGWSAAEGSPTGIWAIFPGSAWICRKAAFCPG